MHARQGGRRIIHVEQQCVVGFALESSEALACYIVMFCGTGGVRWL